MDLFNRAWDILVKEAGASGSDRERKYFLYAFNEMEEPPKEYCIGGKIGPATKVRYEDNKMWVEAAPQDRTSENMMTVAQTNDALIKLMEDFKGA